MRVNYSDQLSISSLLSFLRSSVRLRNVALDTFIVDTGLDEEVFSIDFKQYGALATKG